MEIKQEAQDLRVRFAAAEEKAARVDSTVRNGFYDAKAQDEAFQAAIVALQVFSFF